MSVRVNLHFDKALEITQEGGEKAVYEAANALLREANTQVPIDTGALQRSGTVSQDGLKANVSYDTPYAARWHEQDANFQRGRKKKYLEDPLNSGSFKAQMLSYLQRHIKF